jgi:rhodanese-related sulfurtransferase
MMGQTSWLRNWVLPTWFKELPKDQPIAVICLTAHRSPIAAKALLAMGFSQVFNVTGGMMAWQQAGLPTQKN